MKIRTDFVSNSSSSSFIVISDSSEKTNKEVFSSRTYIEYPNEYGCHRFGREFVKYKSIYDKLNFVGIQILKLYELEHNKLICESKQNEYRTYLPNEWMGKAKELDDMASKVIANAFGIEASLNTDLMLYNVRTGLVHLSYDYYIDHQSSVEEGENMEIFKDENALYKFLAFDGSYIQGGNDNE